MASVAPLRAALFDVDGVLIDSLSAHLRFCQDKSAQFGLSLAIPDVATIRQWIHDGIVISPMREFLRVVGFQNECLEGANNDYIQRFAEDYAPEKFPDAAHMLREISRAGIHLGIVTSNTRNNVQRALADAASLIDPNCWFTCDGPLGNSKSAGLTAAAKTLNLLPSDLIYVGDQPADHEAARLAGTRFLGVTYGWGIQESDNAFPTARNIQEITQYLLNTASARTPEGGSKE